MSAGRSPALPGAMVAGAMLAAAAEVLAGVLLTAAERLASTPGPRLLSPVALYRSWLSAGGWAWVPLWGAALGAAWAAWSGSRGGRRIAGLGLAIALAALPVVWKPVVPQLAPATMPRGATGKAMALRRWAFGDDQAIGRIPLLARDPDPVVREQAMLSLGINRVVANLQGATPQHPSAYAGAPLADSLRRTLERGMGDPAEGVRAEAARALWKAPRAFGPQPAAADTLAAVLDRGLRPGVPERLAWLALDAAAGAPDSGLRDAARRFGERVSDPDLAAAARRAVEGR